MALSGYVVHGVEGDDSRLCGSSTKDSWNITVREVCPAISGVAIDTLLFSRIELPLFHRYRIVSRTGTHAAFRGTYMKRLHAFLEEMDEEWLRHHRRRAQEMAARMSLSSGRDSTHGSADVTTGHTVTLWNYPMGCNIQVQCK